MAEVGAYRSRCDRSARCLGRNAFAARDEAASCAGLAGAPLRDHDRSVMMRLLSLCGRRWMSRSDGHNVTLGVASVCVNLRCATCDSWDPAALGQIGQGRVLSYRALPTRFQQAGRLWAQKRLSLPPHETERRRKRVRVGVDPNP
jgi:hypothetical protein